MYLFKKKSSSCHYNTTYKIDFFFSKHDLFSLWKWQAFSWIKLYVIVLNKTFPLKNMNIFLNAIWFNSHITTTVFSKKYFFFSEQERTVTFLEKDVPEKKKNSDYSHRIAYFFLNNKILSVFHQMTIFLQMYSFFPLEKSNFSLFPWKRHLSPPWNKIISVFPPKNVTFSWKTDFSFIPCLWPLSWTRRKTSYCVMLLENITLFSLYNAIFFLVWP